MFNIVFIGEHSAKQIIIITVSIQLKIDLLIFIIFFLFKKRVENKNKLGHYKKKSSTLANFI